MDSLVKAEKSPRSAQILLRRSEMLFSGSSLQAKSAELLRAKGGVPRVDLCARFEIDVDEAGRTRKEVVCEVVVERKWLQREAESFWRGFHREENGRRGRGNVVAFDSLPLSASLEASSRLAPRAAAQLIA